MGSEMFSEILNTLATEDNKISTMTDLYIYLKSLSSKQLEILNTVSVPFDLLFGCLTEG